MQHRSFGLAALTTEMVKSGDRILDLGPLSSGTTQAFLRLNCQCHIEDLVEYLSENQNCGDPLKALEEHLLPKPANLKFDVILCWDLLNFLDLDVIQHLIRLLQPHLKQGTILHTMRYTGRQQPHKPRRFRLLENFCFEYVDDPSYPEVASKGHSTVTLLKCMDRFSLFNSLMKREGMDQNVTEHFLEYESVTSRNQVRSGGASDVSAYFRNVREDERIAMPGVEKAMSCINTLTTSPTVLECGRKNGRNIDALKKKVGSLYVEDLHASMAWQKKLHGDESGFSASIFSMDPGARLDGVFLWDLLNFYSPQQIQQLGELLGARMTPGAALHFVVYKSAQIPERPATFEVLDDGQVAVTGIAAGKCSRSLSSTAELMRLLPGYRLHNHQIGRLPSGDSYQEFVLQYKP
ncbi:class I SAM-dependent methyltransferase [Microbulbifer pacificus]|uniref:Class I SAM-dependent methyltransferase n=1 Tax=Microbulbifer pacificus TaxID=407164 RepID=A0AAU0N2Y6_9GAMM|nr:class I SAM-dependent methyltransferase [Microbulbifer pacificus]WOX06843.1 class I SAM-dependent methyltransferase [Microbulbifer pacificus]